MAPGSTLMNGDVVKKSLLLVHGMPTMLCNAWHDGMHDVVNGCHGNRR